MNDFSGILPSDFALRSQGKSASMAVRPASGRNSGSNLNFDQSSVFTANPKSQDHSGAFDDILGGERSSKSSDYEFNFDWSGGGGEKSAAAAASPIYDKPVYDDDILDGVPGLKSSSAGRKDDVFSSMSSPSNTTAGAFDDLLGSLGRTGPELKSSPKEGLGKGQKGFLDFDDLIPGFRGTSPGDRSAVKAGRHPYSTAPAAKSTSNTMEDPFVVLDTPSPPEVSSSAKSTDPLEQVIKLSESTNVKANNSSSHDGVFDDLDPLDSLEKTMPAYMSEMNTRGEDRSPIKTGPGTTATQNSFGRERAQKPSVRFDSQPQRTMPVDNNLESRHAFSGMPTASSDPYKSAGPTSSPKYVNLNVDDAKVQTNMSPQFEENLESTDDVWLTVSEIPLFTQPTSAPPPSRPPPPRPVQISKGETGSFDYRNAKKKINEFSAFSNPPQYFQNSKPAPTTARGSSVSQIDELEDFAMGTQNDVDEDRDAISVEEVEANSAAAAMKEAMDRAEAKFRHAKEVRERENVKASRSKGAGPFEREETSVKDAQEKAIREKQERLEQKQREREEEREQKRLEKEKERVREIEREREKARQAVDRATREARERATAEARQRAERAAVEKANAEARERAGRSAVQRAHAEARERLAAEAKGRAEKAAADARGRENAEVREKDAREREANARAEAEARLRADRAFVERAAAEARKRAAAEAQERAASSARANQQSNGNDLESFFSMGAQPSSAPRPRTNSSNKQGAEAARRTSAGASSSIRKASSTANIVDDLTSIFGATPSSNDFQEVEGETEERRRSRFERHQRTQERAAKALAEKNERDLQTQRDQAERHRIAETLDVEIKRWAAGKEGNLRALLSTMQYVLWPECGWQPVSLTDLITSASVKKAYRKATLCIHPDKVQQKGANLQQKYIAEKVFDLLKEAWNKFNSEELV